MCQYVLSWDQPEKFEELILFKNNNEGTFIHMKKKKEEKRIYTSEVFQKNKKKPETK